MPLIYESNFVYDVQLVNEFKKTQTLSQSNNLFGNQAQVDQNNNDQLMQFADNQGEADFKSQPGNKPVENLNVDDDDDRANLSR